MQNFMRRMGLISSLGLVAMLGACGDDGGDKKDTDTKADSEVTETTDTVDETAEDTVEETTGETVEETAEETSTDTDTVEPTFATMTFSIDDSANQTFDESDGLVWKGSFAYDAATNVVALDGSWSGGAGPYPPLYDDGPAPAGHEKPGATAGDHIWTTVVKVATPEADVEFEYGAAYGGSGGPNWIWTGPNGKVTVPAGSTGQTDATGLVIPAFGTVDLKLTIDVSDQGAALDPLFQGVTYGTVTVKGSAWGWQEVAMVDDGTDGDETAGDGVYTFLLSANLGKHSGLLKGGDNAEFVFVLDGTEYKGADGPSTLGVMAYLAGSPVEIGRLESNSNTYVAVSDKVELRFVIDDTANKTYTAADGLEWKGSFTYNAETDLVSFDASWGGGAGPYVPLFDDGPGPTGHEPAGSTAGDHKWSNSVWVSNAETREFEYGAQRGGGQWIWVGSNGKFTVNAGQQGYVDVPGLTIAPFGTVDFRLEIDVSGDGANLNALFQGIDYSGKVKVKGTMSSWQEVALVDDGTKGDATAADGVYTYVLSENVGPNDGLLRDGDSVEFIFVLDGVEYKNGDAEGAREGVVAYSGDGADVCVDMTVACTEEVIAVAGNKNTMVTIGSD